MTILLEILLEEHNVEVYFIECLNQTLFVVTNLGEHILIEPDHSLLVIHWG